MKFLIIDDSAALRILLEKLLRQKWPGAEITGLDPSLNGRRDYPWQDYDLIFLDYDLGLSRETGLDWLPLIKSVSPAPAVILMTSLGSEDIAIRAIRQGADDYIIKHDLATVRLYEMAESCLIQRNRSRTVSTPLPADRSTLGKNNFQEKNDSPPEIPGYRCITEIASGQTKVWLAEWGADGSRAVLKLLSLARKDTVPFRRLIKELVILSDLDHPHVIKVLDRGSTGKYFYYAVPYYPRGDLAGAIQRGNITVSWAVDFILQIAQGLSALHHVGILHRDIKPSNILFDDADNLVIADLGIAKDLSLSQELTLHGQIMGTPFYMSPEQIDGAFVDVRADIYSLGILFYELLTGVRPFPGTSIMEVAYKHAFDPVPRLAPPLAVWQPVLDRMLAKVPEYRYPDMESLIEAVQEMRSG